MNLAVHHLGLAMLVGIFPALEGLAVEERLESCISFGFLRQAGGKAEAEKGGDK